MFRVRILHPAVARLALAPGDELHQQALTPELRALLNTTRVDGLRVATLITDEDEVAVVPSAPEAAVIRSRRPTPRGAVVDELHEHTAGVANRLRAGTKSVA